MLAPRSANAVLYAEGTQPYIWEHPSEATTLGLGDDSFIEIALPFAVPFFDERFSRLRVHSNGFVQFVYSAGVPTTPDNACGFCYTPVAIANTGSPGAPDYLVAVWWADWDPSSMGAVSYGLSPTNSGIFIVSWEGIVPYGSTAQYSFQLRIHKDGTLVVAYKDAVVQGPYDADVVGVVGIQPRAGAQFGFELPRSGSALNLANGSTRSFVQIAPSEQSFDSDPDVPDIVERYAPEWYVDWAPDDYGYSLSYDSRCNTAITRVDFDGDWSGDNVLESLWAFDWSAYQYTYATPAHVYYSLVETKTHYLIGYYVYHAYDCTLPNWGCDNEHEHDFGGIHIAVNKLTRDVDAMLSNAHGDRVPYKSLNPDITIQQRSNWGSTSKHLTMVGRWQPFLHERPAVGIENDTHAIWGRYDDRCIIGGAGSPSGCNTEHGGDGFILTYDINNQGPQEPTSLYTGGFDQYPNWLKYRYKLLPISAELFTRAQDPAQCGDDGQLYACPAVTNPPFHNTFNGESCDKGDLP